MKKAMFGNDMDRMPDWAFKTMAFMFRVTDLFISPAGKLDPFNIQKGQTVVDYGSGTGRYLEQAAKLVGQTGIVYAVDIQPLAVESAKNLAVKRSLPNIRPILTDGKSVNIPVGSVDVIYALDMFHMVSDHQGILGELHRIARPGGLLFLEDGHQPREKSKEKVLLSGQWEIVEETKGFLKCRKN
jgi:ubiquinone/menaquinone biosynthesis C-methylase UbiE